MERLDCLYRIGLAHYYAGRYAQALETFENGMSLCDEEMGIAVIYWHTLSAVRAEEAPTLLKYYRLDMAVGHHTAYKKAMQVWSGITPLSAMLQMLESEEDDLEYGITLYGLLCIRTALKRASFPKPSLPGRLLAQLRLSRCVERQVKSLIIYI